MRVRSVGLAVGTLVAVLLAGCSVPSDDRARVVDAKVDDIFVPVAEADGSDDAIEIVVWLADEGGLVPSIRFLEADPPSTAEYISAALSELFDGPRARDASAGLRSAIPPGTTLLGISLVDSVATVELSTDITRVGGADEVLAIAQIVLTATEVPDVQRVRFVVDEEPTQVPVANGALTSRAVTAADYEDLTAP